MSEKIDVDFGGWIQKGFDIWKENILTLALATLIALCVSIVSILILAGPMAAGLTMMVLAMHDQTQPKPQIGDLFKGFQLLVPSLLFILIMAGAGLVLILFNMVPCIGSIVAMAGSFALGTLVLFALCFIVDKRMPVIEAIKASIEIVKGNFWPFLGLYIVISAISGAGVIACCVGIFASIPMALCIQVVAYRACTRGETIDVTPVEPPPPAPPPGAAA